MQKWCVTDVKTLDNYKLLVSFFSGERKIYDAKPLLQYKINEPLKNKNFFRLAHVNEVHTVAWNENIDIDPERRKKHLTAKKTIEKTTEISSAV